jgi:hypothetical protein
MLRLLGLLLSLLLLSLLLMQLCVEMEGRHCCSETGTFRCLTAVLAPAVIWTSPFRRKCHTCSIPT